MPNKGSVMRDKEKQEQASDKQGKRGEEKTLFNRPGPPPILDDESFARRAGELIARAVGTAEGAVRHGSKSK
jgi:hypothetical protein